MLASRGSRRAFGPPQPWLADPWQRATAMIPLDQDCINPRRLKFLDGWRGSRDSGCETRVARGNSQA